MSDPTPDSERVDGAVGAAERGGGAVGAAERVDVSVGAASRRGGPAGAAERVDVPAGAAERVDVPAGAAERMGGPAGAAERMGDWPTGRLLSMAARLVEHAWAQALEQRGLSHAGLVALHVLDSGPRSQTELAREARVQTQTMSRTLDRLEREGYVARARAADDARRHVVTRTDAGTRVWLEARTLEADMFPQLEDPEGVRATLLDIIAAASALRWQP